MIIEMILEFLENLLGELDFTSIIIILGAIIIFFLLVREVYTWYWKLNKIVYNQSKQNELLEEILEEIKSQKKEK